MANAAEFEEKFDTDIHTFNGFICNEFHLKEMGRLETIMKNVVGGIVFCEYSGGLKFLYASVGFLQLIGYSADDIQNILKGNFSQLIVESDYDLTLKNIAEQLKESDNFSVEYRITAKNGKIIWILNNGILIKSNNKPDMLKNVLVDITSKIKTVEAFAASEKKNNDIKESFQEQLELIKKLKRIDERFKFIISSVCDNFIEVDIKTGKSTMTHVKSSMEVKDNFYDQIQWIADNMILPEEREEYLEKFDLNNLIVKLKENNGIYTTGINSFHSGSMHNLLIVSALISDSNDGGEYIFSYAQDVTETMMLKKEKQYGDTLASNLQLTYEANITQDTVIAYDPAWADELKVSGVIRFSEMVEKICMNAILPEHIQVICDKLNSKAIFDAYEEGHRLSNFQYKKRVSGCRDEYQWVEHTLNIIKEQPSGDIIVRSYIVNIDQRKKKELKAFEEQIFYESMVSKSALVYEVNVTRNLFVSGHEKWFQLYGFKPGNAFKSLILQFEKKVIHPLDRKSFHEYFAIENILSRFKSKMTESTLEYRKLDEDGGDYWVRCNMHIIEDPLNGDIKSFTYVERIDIEKKKELELIYKSQHDLLTECYNKATVEEKISNFVDSEEVRTGRHAFFIIDLDYFKAINDNFGHAFGDSVLSNAAKKLKKLFRSNDIIGRIGGDEFVILMKNISGELIVREKAGEICNTMTETFTQKGVELIMTVSIGIAIFGINGGTYQELYRHSDAALYYSKECGRNTFSIYNEYMQSASSAIKAIDIPCENENGNLTSNITDSILKILYETSDKKQAVNMALKLIGEKYGLSRVYIFETSDNKMTVSNTFEWCNSGISREKDNLQKVMRGKISQLEESFDNEGICFVGSLCHADDETRSFLEKQEIKSMIYFSIVRNGEFMGFFGVDQCDGYRAKSGSELKDFRRFTNILSLFLFEMRSSEIAATTMNVAISTLNGLNTYTYICNPSTYEIVFLNSTILKMLPEICIGDVCYTAIHGFDSPCKDCPIQELRDSNQTVAIGELYNKKFKLWGKANFMWVEWFGKGKCCLVNVTDVTEYKKNCKLSQDDFPEKEV